jgi:uncharacterized membrane protein YqjE
MTTQQVREMNPTHPEDRSIAQLVGDLTEQLGRLVRDEMRLATIELRRKGRKLQAGTGFTGFAALTGVIGLLALVAAAILWLATVVAPWTAAVLVGGAFLVISALAGLIGRRKLRQATPPVPEEAMAGVQDDVRAVKEGVRG